MNKPLFVITLAITAGACASTQAGPSTSSASTASAAAPARVSVPPRSSDPRVGLKAGWMNAGEAAWNVRLVSNTPPSSDFVNPANPGDFNFINSDLSFIGPYVFQGNFGGFQV